MKILLAVVLSIIFINGFSQTTFEKYGAVGDGVTNDRIAIINAINADSTILAKPGAIYYISESVEIVGKSVNIIGDEKKPAVFLFKNQSNFRLKGTASVTTTLKYNTKENDQFFIVNDISGFQVGNLVTITTSTAKSWGYDISNDYRMGEIHKIIGIKSDTIYVEDKIWHSWTYSGQILKVRQYIPISVNLKNVKFIWEPPQPIGNGLLISIAKNNVLENVTIKDAQYSGCVFNYCYNSKFINGSVEGSNLNGLGYGLRFENSSFSEVTGSNFSRNIKSIESSTQSGVWDYGLFPNRNLIITNNFPNGNGFTSDGKTIYSVGGRFVNTHAPSQNVLIVNNLISNYHTSVGFSGVDVTFSNNRITGKSMYVAGFYFGNNYEIKGNVFTGLLENAFLYLDNLSTGRVVVSNNTASAIDKYFILCGGTTLMDNVTIQDNNIYASGNFKYNLVGNSKLKEPTIIDNFVKGNGVIKQDKYDFGINGQFNSALGWTVQNTWSIANGQASCNALTSANTTTAALMQLDVGIALFPNEKFTVSLFVVQAAAGAKLAVYSPVGGYIIKDLIQGRYINYEITANSSYPGLTLVNWALNKPFTIDDITITRQVVDRSNKVIYISDDNYNLKGYKLNINNLNVDLPKDSTFLEKGDVYINNNTLKVKQ